MKINHNMGKITSLLNDSHAILHRKELVNDEYNALHRNMDGIYRLTDGMDTIIEEQRAIIDVMTGGKTFHDMEIKVRHLETAIIEETKLRKELESKLGDREHRFNELDGILGSTRRLFLSSNEYAEELIGRISDLEDELRVCKGRRDGIYYKCTGCNMIISRSKLCGCMCSWCGGKMMQARPDELSEMLGEVIDDVRERNAVIKELRKQIQCLYIPCR